LGIWCLRKWFFKELLLVFISDNISFEHLASLYNSFEDAMESEIRFLMQLDSSIG
jgi:hypothetical protein